MKTNRDALWSLVFLAGLPALLFGAMQVLALAMPDTAREPYHTALVMALGLVWLAPSALWQERKPASEHGPRAICRNMRDVSALLMLQLVVVAHDANTVANLLFFLGLFSLLIGVPLFLPFRKTRLRPRLLALRFLARRMLRRIGFATLLAAPLWMVAQATAAQALWIWLICLGVVSTVVLPETLPRHGATRLGRGVISIGEHLSFGAALLTFLVLSGFGRPDDPDQQIAYLMISTIGIAGALTAVTLVFAWLDWRGQTPNRRHK